MFLFRNQINNWKKTLKKHKSKLTHLTESLTFSFSYFLTTCSPKYRGTYCLGERRRYKICNITPCPQEVPTFRDVQCGHFNVLPYKGTFYKWETVFNKGEQAKLMLNCHLEELIHVNVTLCPLLKSFQPAPVSCTAAPWMKISRKSCATPSPMARCATRATKAEICASTASAW